MKMIRRKEDMNAANGTQGKTLVHLAAEHGQLTLLEKLTERDAILHVRTRATRDTPAHLAVRHGHHKVLLDRDNSLHSHTHTHKHTLDFALSR